MTHEEISLNTKRALCDSLKRLMKQKPFSKITVSELIRDCNVNRNTFYYHFEDIYGLLRWMLEQETFEVVKQFDLMVDYQEAFLFGIDYVEKNSYFLNCIYDSVGRDELKRFFYKDFVGIVELIVKNCERQMNVTLGDEYRDFMTEFYTEGIAGMIINLFQQPGKYDKESLLEYLTSMLSHAIPAAVQGGGRD